MKAFALILGLLFVAVLVTVGMKQVGSIFVRGMSGDDPNEGIKQPSPEQKETKDR